MPIELAYAQARIQARNGQRLTPRAWQALEASEELPHYLHAARVTGMRAWVERLSERTDAHDIERSLRRDWRREVEHVSRWMPERWRPAVMWVRTLVDLPAVMHILKGGAVYPWMREEPFLKPVARAAMDARWQGLGETELAPVADHLAGDADALKVWCAHFRSLWPDRPGELKGMEQLSRRIEAHFAMMRGDEVSLAEAPARRERLERQLVKTLRGDRQLPAAVFSYLGLLALDLRRLRGQLAVRALFPAAAGE